MRAVIVDDLPLDLDALKRAQPSQARVNGITTFAASFARALVRHGTWDEYVFVDRGSPHRLAIDSTSDGRVRVIPAADVATLASRERAVLVGPASSMASIARIRQVCGRADWPVVGFTHALHAATAGSVLLQLVAAGIAPHDALVCSSKAGRGAVRCMIREAWRLVGRDSDQPACHLPVIPLGVGTDMAAPDRGAARQQLGIATHDVVLLYVGRFSAASKGDLRPLITAYAREFGAGSHRPLLVLAGDDTECAIGPSLSKYAELLGCGDRVWIRPNISNAGKAAWMAAADVFVSPAENVQETFGLAIVEAMLAGLPVVASDWSGYREIVLHGETGYLVPTCWAHAGAEIDLWEHAGAGLLASQTAIDIAGLRQCLRRLVERPDLRASLGARGRRVARERFAWQAIMRAYEALWEDLIERGRAMAPAPVTSSSAATPCWLQRIFADYPTATLHDDDHVRPNARAWANLTDDEMLLILSEGDPAPLRSQLKAFVDAHPPHQPIAIRDLMALGMSALDQSAARALVMRLLKFGLLELDARSRARMFGGIDALATSV